MPDLEFIKLKTYMFDDEKIRIIESMPDADSLLVIWVKLLCQAGKTYAGGYIFLNENIPYTEEELASVLSRPLNTVKLALKVLERLDMITINDNGLFIKNFPKHQNLEAIEQSREKARLRQQKHRRLLSTPKAVTGESRNSHSDVTLQNKTKNKTKNKIYTSWNNQNIIRHRKFTDAIKRAIKIALKDNTEDEIIIAIKNYAEILRGSEYYFKYSWTLTDFLKRGLSKFLDLEIAKRNYMKDGEGGTHKQGVGKLPKTYTHPDELRHEVEYED